MSKQLPADNSRPVFPPRYEAEFSDGVHRYTHGTFATPEEADEFGKKFHTPGILAYIGWVQPRSPIELGRMIVAKKIRRDQENQPDTRRIGAITRWHPAEAYGFITDAESRTWFVPARSDLPEEVQQLRLYSKVTFTGSPHPQPGKKYPSAYSLHPFDADEHAAGDEADPPFAHEMHRPD